MGSNKFTQGHLTKIKWLVANLRVFGSPDKAEHAIFWVILAGRFFFADSGCISGRGATLSCRNPLLSSNKFTQGHLMKIKWLVADRTAVASPFIAERAILGVILAERRFCQFRLYFWSGSPFAM